MRYYIFEVRPADQGSAEPYMYREQFEIESRVKAQKVLASEAYADGRYLVLADVGGIITKSTETSPKVKLTIESPRTRKRKASAPTDPKAAPKKAQRQ